MQTLYKFYASWCGPCKSLGQALENINLPYEVKNVDVDKDIDLTKKYNVRSLPTLVLTDDDGEVLRTMVGFTGVEKLKKFISG